jgi:hypothetical protein
MSRGTYAPLQPNPGGVVDPNDLVGRKGELKALLGAVSTGGAYVVGDRRMGKTSLLRKMREELEAAGHSVIAVSAETSSLDEFGGQLMRAVRENAHLERWWSKWSKEVRGEVKLAVAGQGIHLTGSMASGPAAETDLLHLCGRAAQDAGAASLVLVIDEIAVLAQHLSATSPGSAEELLRTLRRIRQDESMRVRVVLAGSVGLHHAITDETSLNDLPRVEIGPLTSTDAFVLAQRLLVWTRDNPDNELAAELADACSDIPYYIHRLVSADEQGAAAITAAEVRARVDEAIDCNEWHTDHYVRRLSTYFGGDSRYAVALLDVLGHDGPADLDSLSNGLASQFYDDPPSRATVANILDKLRKDHYLDYRDGTYAWTTEFLRTVWIRTRRRL